MLRFLLESIGGKERYLPKQMSALPGIPPLPSPVVFVCRHLLPADFAEVFPPMFFEGAYVLIMHERKSTNNQKFISLEIDFAGLITTEKIIFVLAVNKNCFFIVHL